MSQQVNFKIMVQGLANHPMRFEVRYINAADGITIVTQLLNNVCSYLTRGYPIKIENLFVIANVP